MAQPATRLKNDRLIQFAAPEVLNEALEKAADKRFTSKASYLRIALLDRLKADGIEPQRPDGALA